MCCSNAFELTAEDLLLEIGNKDMLGLCERLSKETP